uniref:Uncharacterized mitochondrial protein AtMg00810-like n=1 Tax=Nicotiana tabacum TaxID=4097 RepID=A0A1S4CAL6_TOBAC|nr:PREDICTED: uncharacterized mitochondrial protein AtMg00810-like [Nicotiana tabacum]
MAPHEALYGRRCRSAIDMFKVGEAELLGLDLVYQAVEEVKLIPRAFEYDLKFPKVLFETGSYWKLIGKLLYLTITRPDIYFAVQVLSQFMQHPKESHMEVALRVVKYIKGSPRLGILLKSGNTNSLTPYCDSDWVACPNTRRSVTSYVVKLGDSLLSWKSKKQQTVSISSAEAEYRSIAVVMVELM